MSDGLNGDPDEQRSLTLQLTADIVASFLSGNRASPEQVPALISEVHRALSGLLTPAPVDPGAEARVPSRAEVKRSIRPDGLVSFEDGRVYKVLKRHLTRQGLTPDEYRAKWACRRTTQWWRPITPRAVRHWPSRPGSAAAQDHVSAQSAPARPADEEKKRPPEGFAFAGGLSTGWRPACDRLTPGNHARLALARAAKAVGLPRPHSSALPTSFRLDPAQPGRLLPA